MPRQRMTQQLNEPTDPSYNLLVQCLNKMTEAMSYGTQWSPLEGRNLQSCRDIITAVIETRNEREEISHV